MKTPVKAVIYSRISTSKQNNIERQQTELEPFCEANNIEIIEAFEDVGVSGTVSTTERLNFQKMLQYVEANSIELILATEISRIGRDNLDVLNTIKFLNDSKINLYLNDLKFYTLNSDKTINYNAQLLINIVTALAENERVQLISRAKSGRSNAVRKKGIYVMRPVYGYRVIDKVLTISGSEKGGEAYNVVLLFEYFKKSKSLFQTEKYFRYLTKENKSFGKKLRRVLTNTRYIGYYEFEGEKFDCPSIIDETLFNEVQAILKTNDAGKQTGKNEKYIKPLKGITNCNCCNTGVNYHIKKRKNTKSIYYICNCIINRQNLKPNSTFIKADVLHNIILDFALAYYSTTEINKGKVEELNEKNEGNNIKIKELEAKIREEESNITQTKKLFLKKLFTVDELEADINKYRANIERFEKQIQHLYIDNTDLERSLKLYTNKTSSVNSILTINNFAQFCQDNIKMIKVEKCDERIRGVFNEKVVKNGHQQVFKIEIESNFIDVALYASSNKPVYVIEPNRYEECILDVYEKFVPVAYRNMDEFQQLTPKGISASDIIENDIADTECCYWTYQKYDLLKDFEMVK